MAIQAAQDEDEMKKKKRNKEKPLVSTIPKFSYFLLQFVCAYKIGKNLTNLK